MIVRFIALHYQLLCPGAEPGNWHHAKVVIGDWSEEQTNGERCDASTAAYDAGGGYARSAKREPIAVVTPATSFVLFTSSLRRLRAQGPAGTGGTLLLQGRGAVDVRGDRNAGEGGGD